MPALHPVALIARALVSLGPSGCRAVDFDGKSLLMLRVRSFSYLKPYGPVKCAQIFPWDQTLRGSSPIKGANENLWMSVTIGTSGSKFVEAGTASPVLSFKVNVLHFMILPSLIKKTSFTLRSSATILAVLLRMRMPLS